MDQSLVKIKDHRFLILEARSASHVPSFIRNLEQIWLIQLSDNIEINECLLKMGSMVLIKKLILCLVLTSQSAFDTFWAVICNHVEVFIGVEI